MKKIAKMSLVAAVAIAGLTSTASASSLEEAVKNTDINGYVRYRFNKDYQNHTDTKNELKVVLKTKTKVNEFVTVNTKFVQTNSGKSDAVTMSMGYFTYANEGVTFSAGRQGLVSPMTDNGNAGDGVVATYGMKNVTIAGAYYNGAGNHENSFQDAKAVDIYGGGILASAGPVNLAAWYLTTADKVDNKDVDQLSAFSLAADTSIEMVKLSAFYSEADDKDNLAADNSDREISFLDLGVSAKIGMVSASLDYIKTGKDSGNTTLDNDTDAQANNGLMQVDTMLYRDADFVKVGLSADVTKKINLGIHHINGESINADIIETELRAIYKMSKNFNVMARYSFGEDIANMDANDRIKADEDSVDFDRARVQILYTF